MEQLCLSAVICCNVYHNFYASHFWWVPSTTSLRKYWNVPLSRRVNDQHLKATVLLARTTTCSAYAMQIPFFCSRGKLLLSLPWGSGSSVFSFKNWALRSAPLSTCVQAVNTNVWVLTSCFSLFLFFFSFLLTHPDFTKLPRSKFLHHLDRIFGNLPGVFVPRLLSFGFYTRAVQFSTQAVSFVWEVHHKDAESYFIPAFMLKTRIIQLKRKVNSLLTCCS